MGMFFFYNNRKPRKFNHSPILYDPDKEERKEQMEKRIRRMREEVAREEGRTVETQPETTRKTDFGEEFLSQTKYLKRRKEREKDENKPFFTSNITIVLLIVALLFIFYFVFLR